MKMLLEPSAKSDGSLLIAFPVNNQAAAPWLFYDNSVTFAKKIFAGNSKSLIFGDVSYFIRHLGMYTPQYHTSFRIRALLTAKYFHTPSPRFWPMNAESSKGDQCRNHSANKNRRNKDAWLHEIPSTVL